MKVESHNEDILTIHVGRGDRTILAVDLAIGIALSPLWYLFALGLDMPWRDWSAAIFVLMMLLGGMTSVVLSFRSLKLLFTNESWTFSRDVHTVRYLRIVCGRIVEEAKLEFQGITTSIQLTRSESLLIRALPIFQKRYQLNFMDARDESLHANRMIDAGTSGRQSARTAEDISTLTGVENLSA